MKTFLRSLFILAVIVIQSCSNNDDNDCSTILCEQPAAVLEFRIVNSETGENIGGTIISGSAIKVKNTASDSEENYEFITENNSNILRIFISNSGEYSVNYGNEVIFTFSIDVSQNTDGCCTITEVNEIKIAGADYELDKETGVYIIKKDIKSHLISGESLENYHAFFENSQLQIIPGKAANQDNEFLDIDVVQGDKLVFKLITHDDPEETVADDEITRIVYFEIDPESTEFTLNPDNFEEENAVIGLSASISYIKPVMQGEISGTKISNDEWQVEVNASVGEEGEAFSIKLEESKRSFNRSTYEDVWMPIYQTHVFK